MQGLDPERFGTWMCTGAVVAALVEEDSDGYLPGQAWRQAFHWVNEMPAEQILDFFYTYKIVGTCNKESLIACF